MEYFLCGYCNLSEQLFDINLEAEFVANFRNNWKRSFIVCGEVFTLFAKEYG